MNEKEISFIDLFIKTIDDITDMIIEALEKEIKELEKENNKE